MFVAMLVAAALLDNQGGAFGLVGGSACGVGVVVLWIRGEASMPKAGIYESADGLRVVGLGLLGGLRALQVLSWAQIDRFETRRVAKHRVAVIARHGRGRLMLGARQGARYSWGDDETRDIAGVLNQRVNEWRASQVPS